MSTGSTSSGRAFLRGDSASSGQLHHHPGFDWVKPLTEVNEMTSPSHEALLIGPSESYRLGDLLRPHILTRLLNLSKLRCAGLVRANLTSVGGHQVKNFGESLLEMGGKKLELLHYGGETLGMDLIEAYAVAAGEEESERFESLAAISGPEELRNFVSRRSGQPSQSPYVLAPEGGFYGSNASFHAVGFSAPESLSDEQTDELVRVLKGASFVGIRDERGADFLEAKGVTVERMPCGLTVLPQICSRQLRERHDSPAMEAVRNRFPNGWMAVGISNVREEHFLGLSASLKRVSEERGLGLVFFDEDKNQPGESSPQLRKWVSKFAEWDAIGFGSDNIWDVASLLLHSRLYCGGCLSSRIICMSGGVARINLPTGKADTLSYCELWEHDTVPIEFSEDEPWIIGLNEALDVDLSVLQQHSKWLHERYFESFAKFCEQTGMSQRLIPGQADTEHARASVASHHLQDEWLNDERSTRLFRRLNRRRKRIFDRTTAADSHASDQVKVR